MLSVSVSSGGSPQFANSSPKRFSNARILTMPHLLKLLSAALLTLTVCTPLLHAAEQFNHVSISQLRLERLVLVQQYFVD